MKLGDVVIDVGAIPSRLGIIVDIRKTTVTIAHLKDFLSFESEHRWQTLGFEECHVILELGENHKVVQKLIKEFEER